MALPDLNSANDGYVRLCLTKRWAYTQMLVIVMIDERGKANPSVKNALNLFMYERKMGGYKLHPDSIVSRGRLTKVVRVSVTYCNRISTIVSRDYSAC